MIFAGNFKTHKGSSKKLGAKKGGGANSYSGNFDWLLGFAPIVYVATVWRNKDDFFPAFTGSQTFTSQFGISITNNPGPLLGIVAVVATVDVSQTFNDYGAPGPVTVTGQQQIPLYPAGQNNIPFNNIAPGGLDFSVYPPPAYRVTSTPVPTDISLILAGHTPAVTVDSGHPVTVFYVYSPKSKPPLAQAKLVFESELGNGVAFSFSGGSAYQVLYPEFSGISGKDVDLGTGNSAPNDNFEVQSLYAYAPSGDANPADAIMDVILSGNPVEINDQTSGYNWNHGLGFGIQLTPQGMAQFPNVLLDPPVPP